MTGQSFLTSFRKVGLSHFEDRSLPRFRVAEQRHVGSCVVRTRKFLVLDDLPTTLILSGVLRLVRNLGISCLAVFMTL